MSTEDNLQAKELSEHARNPYCSTYRAFAAGTSIPSCAMMIPVAVILIA
jgi:hypothetical protein